MLTRYLPNGQMNGVCLHNTAHWQVTEYLGGYACEVLQKQRQVDERDRRAFGLSLHDCFGSVFFQGDEADAFLSQLREAQLKLSPARIDHLVLSAYTEVLTDG